MILLDYQQTCIADLMAQLGAHTNTQLEEGLLRHMILNSIRSHNVKYRGDFGKMVIACDDRHYWRKDIFPHYKANRKKKRDESDLDWNFIFDTLNKIKMELRTFFPYPVIQVEKAEADDVIATLADKSVSEEKVLILSGDKDFMQLQKYPNVVQYDPVRKRWLSEEHPYKYVQEHTIRGDVGDGVPNVLSDDDTLVNPSKRQKALTQKRLDLLMNSPIEDPIVARNFKRNQQLIDLDYIPQDIKNQIVEEYTRESFKTKSNLLDYFIEYRLTNLTSSINDF
jgi:hypothetical protein